MKKNGVSAMKVQFENPPDDINTFIRQRQQFAECHYTLMLSVIQLQTVKDEVEELEFQLLKTGTPIDHLALDKHYLLFHAIIGRCYDMLKRMGILSKNMLKEVSVESIDGMRYLNGLSSFWKRRITEIHGVRVFLKLDKDGFVLVPEFDASIDENTDWESAKKEAFTSVGTYMNTILDDFARCVNAALASAQSDVNNIVKKYGLSLVRPPTVLSRLLKDSQTPLSGSRDEEIHPSGVAHTDVDYGSSIKGYDHLVTGGLIHKKRKK